MKLDGPFVPGEVSRGQITYPGYEHLKWEAVVQKMEPERLFSFTWHPYAVDPDTDYSEGDADAGRIHAGEDGDAARCCASSSPASTRCRRIAATRPSA